MANLNDREDNLNQVPNPGESNVVDPNPVDYKDGYLQGRAVEQHRHEANQQVRDNDNAGRGLLIGLILAGTAAIVGGALYLLNQSNQTPAPVNRTIVVPGAAASPSVSPSPEVRERVIERDRVVPVPQAPSVNITIPQPSAPATQVAPATQAAPAAQPSSQPTTPKSSAQPSSSPNSTTNGSENSPSSGTTNPTGTGSGQ
ncbi:MAG: hypothetical protein H7126_06320 [Candidatus Parcubacteria bacterium]|nr:hypothetical protein [Leptolyngbyaceae cyanobacterium LF-bin-113]